MQVIQEVFDRLEQVDERVMALFDVLDGLTHLGCHNGMI